MTRHVVLYPDEDGWWIAEMPSLPGCNNQGETRAQALINVQDAITGYVELLREDGQSIPEDNVELVTSASREMIEVL